MNKKLKIAFVWHFHQPVYQEKFDEDFLMPWVRLHATKDYLDMLLRMDNFKNLRLNFDISPTLADSLERYANGAKDESLRLLVKKTEELNNQEKGYILNNFFDANYNNLVLKRPGYARLYNKRFSAEDIGIEDFTNQEYSDILAHFTLAWIDKKFFELYPELNEISKKDKDYTLEDRIKISEYSLKIITDIIPTYKKYQEEGKIEISTTPYYHPILPLLIDLHELYCPYDGKIPKEPCSMTKDALEQTKKGLDRFEQLFGKRPKGVWLSEESVSERTVELLSKLGVEWTIADIGILSDTIDKEFVRGFEGNLEDPFSLCCDYKIKKGSKKLNTTILFSDAFMANLVGFGYNNYDSQYGANDLYEKIKTIQSKLQNSPKENHLLTIAMDGENCWESYPDDGDEFLNLLYGLIEHDPTLETVLISDYLKKDEKSAELPSITSGSWINRNFNLWIGEPVKNIAWSYVNKLRQAVDEFSKTCRDKKLLEKVMEEIYILQGSDWFWWYGEPNDSGQDHVFDRLFRAHLKNAYRLMSKDIPSELNIPLISVIGKPIRYPRKNITPKITGELNSENNSNLMDAGYIFLPDSPMFPGRKVIRGIHYGNDLENIYFRFEIDKENIRKIRKNISNELYIYFRNRSKANSAPVRLTNKTKRIFPILKNYFTHEIKFYFNATELYPPYFSEATSGGLWTLKPLKKVKYAYKDFMETAISFEDLEIEQGQSVEFCMIAGQNGILDELFPQDMMLKLTNI